MARVVVEMGHTVIARELDIDEVGQVTRDERPDVALVGLGESSQHALDHISRIVREATCPVIALLNDDDAAFIRDAADRGIFAYITDGDPEEFQSSIDIALRRFADYHNLEGAFGRRAVIERAKGILMERHSLTDQQSFELLRAHSQRSGRKLYDLATAKFDSYLLFAAPRAVPPTAADDAGSSG